MSLLERHMSVIAFILSVIYVSMFIAYITLDINSGHFVLAFLVVLFALLLSLIAFGIKFVARELSDI